jgi:tellurite methyltransferase
MTNEKYHFEENVFSREDYEFGFEFDEKLINEILNLKKEGKVLDLGCGEGGNSLRLSEIGFDVTCVDISETAIKKIKEEADSRNLKIKTICGDLEDLKIEEKYEIIFSTGAFHFLPKNKLKNLISQIRRKTNKGGFNIFEVLLEGDPSQEDDSEGYYFKSDELKEIYCDWDILRYSEEEIFDEEEKWNNKVGFLIAMKR